MASLYETVSWSGHGLRTKLRRWQHRPGIRRALGKDGSILAALERDGGCTTTLDALAIADSDMLLKEGDRLMKEMESFPKHTGSKSYITSAPPATIIRYPRIIRWGLDERLLAIAQAYIGMPVSYRGVLARLDFPDGQVLETRIWHLDQEDSRILKVIVYLNDISDDGGPFEFIPASASPPLHLAKGPKLRVEDTRVLEKDVPPHRWKAVTGPRGTVAFADTCAVLHRGRLPTTAPRQTLFFCYNSHWPYRPTYCEPMFSVEQFLASAGPLTQVQRSALEYPYV